MLTLLIAAKRRTIAEESVQVFNVGGAELGLILIVLAVVVPPIWAIVDIIQRPPERFPRWSKAGTSDKTGWIIALVVGWVIGLGWLVAIVYLIVVRRKMGPATQGASVPPPTPPPSVPG